MSYSTESGETTPVKALAAEIEQLAGALSSCLNLLEQLQANIHQPGAIPLSPPVALPSLPSLGERIRFVRMVKDLSQDELAARVGVSRATINYAERGKTHPNGLTSAALAAALGCDHFWLVTGLGNPAVNPA